MPRERSPRPSTFYVDLAQHLTERKNAVEAIEIELGQFSGGGDRAMVRVMKQQYEARAGNAAAANLRDQPGRIPFMHQGEIRVLQSFVEVRLPFVATNRHAGNQSGNFKPDRLP